MGARQNRTDEAADRDAIALPDRLDIGAAGPLRALLAARDGNVVLDASGSSIVTTPGAQVLMAFRDHQALRGRTVTLRSASRPFLACLATLGISPDRLQTEGAAA